MASTEKENQKLEQGTQRRHLTVLFADLSRSTEIIDAVDEEDFNEFLPRLYDLFSEVIHRYGGTVAQLQGDGVFAIFGLEPHEDEGRRAVAAALELHQKVKELPLNTALAAWGPMTLHSGIHAGVGLAVPGNALTGAYRVVGAPANVASRLSAMAGADELLASAASLGSDISFFETGPPLTMQLKGLSDAVPAYSILGTSSVQSRFQSRRRQTHSQLIGRAADLDILLTSFRAATGGNAQVITLVGSPGLGKTRLADEFLGSIEGDDCAVLRGYCESFLNAEPMQAVVQLLRQVLQLPAGAGIDREVAAARLAEINDELAHYAETVSAMLSSSLPDESSMVRAMTAITSALAQYRPLVVFIDDWQWADNLTRSVLRPLANFDEERLLFLRANREDEGERGQTTIALEPLAVDDCSQMVKRLLPDANPRLTERVSQSSGGNPLFIEELCHDVSHKVRDGSDTPPDTLEVSGSLNNLIDSRIDRIAADLRDLLETIAVLGNVVPIWLIEATSGSADLVQEIHRLGQADLVYFTNDDQDTVRFKHGITREVVLRTTNRERRRSLHLKAAKAIESRTPDEARESNLEALAYHYGGTTDHLMAATYAQSAGDKAFTGAAMDRARLQYQAALEALSRIHMETKELDFERWVKITRRFAQACLFDSQPNQCLVFEKTAELAAERGALKEVARAKLGLANIRYALGDPGLALDAIESAIALRGELPESLVSQLIACRGQIHGLAGAHAAACQDIDHVLAQQEERGPDVAYSLAAKGMVLGDLGRFREAAECFAEAEHITRKGVHQIQGSILSMHAGVCCWQGEWDDALQYAERGIDVGNRTGSRYITASSEALAAYAKWRLGDANALTDMVRATAWIEAAHQAIWTSMHFSWLCEALVEAGQIGQARHAAAFALNRNRRREPLGAAVTLCALAQASDEATRAKRYLSRAKRTAAARGSAREQALVDFYLLKLNGADTAALKDNAATFRSMDMNWHAQQAEALAAN